MKKHLIYLFVSAFSVISVQAQKITLKEDSISLKQAFKKLEAVSKYKIAYNDNKPLERIRFTVCEECMHILLGHTKNPSFNAFQQSYSPPTYAQYDEEARIGAGLIICPSQFYYAHSNEISSTHLCRICRISEPCANIRQGSKRAGRLIRECRV